MSGVLLRPATCGGHRRPSRLSYATHRTRRRLRHCTGHAPSNAASATAGARRHGGRGVGRVLLLRARGDYGVRSTCVPTDGTDALGIVGRVVIGWSGHERAARRAASCRQDDMNANEKAGSTTGWTTLLLDCGVSADTIR